MPLSQNAGGLRKRSRVGNMTDVSGDAGAITNGDGAAGAADAAGAESAGGEGGDDGGKLFQAFEQFQQQMTGRFDAMEQRLPPAAEEEGDYEDDGFDPAQFFEEGQFSDDDFTDDGTLSTEAQMRALAEMQRAIVREEMAPIHEAREQDRRDAEAVALEQRYPELADEQNAQRYVQEAVDAAQALGQPLLAREPSFLEMTYLAAKARERAGQEIPAGGAPGVTLETGPGGSPGAGGSDDDAGERIVNAGGRKPFRISG